MGIGINQEAAMGFGRRVEELAEALRAQACREAGDAGAMAKARGLAEELGKALGAASDAQLEEALEGVVKAARASMDLARLFEWREEALGPALEPLARDGRLWRFGKGSGKPWMELHELDWGRLAEDCPETLGAHLARDRRFWEARSERALEDPQVCRVPSRLEPPASKSRKGRAGELGAQEEAHRRRWIARGEGLIKAWEIGFESGALAGLAGTQAGARLMMGLICCAPLETVERARAAGLDVRALDKQDAERGFARLALLEDPEAALYQEARPERRWTLGKAEREEFGRLAAEGSAARRSERWRLAQELGAPKVELTEATARWMTQAPRRVDGAGSPAPMDGPHLNALAVAVAEASRDGALEGRWAGWFWSALQQAEPACLERVAALGGGIGAGEAPLAFALRSGLDKRQFEGAEAWRAGALESGEAGLAALERAGVSASGWRGGHFEPSAVKEALSLGVGREGLMSLARMKASFSPPDREEGLLLFAIGLGWPESEMRGRLEGLLEAAEAREPGGAARLLSERAPGSGAGAMCAAARALSPAALGLLKERGLSLEERDAKGRGLLFWASKKYSDTRQGALRETLGWLGGQGFDWESKSAKGELDAAWLGRRGSAERAVEALKAVSKEAGEAIEKAALGRLTGAGKAALERHVMGEVSKAGPEPGEAGLEPAGRARSPRL